MLIGGLMRQTNTVSQHIKTHRSNLALKVMTKVLTRLEEAWDDGPFWLSDDCKAIGIGRHQCDEISYVLRSGITE